MNRPSIGPVSYLKTWQYVRKRSFARHLKQMPVCG